MDYFVLMKLSMRIERKLKSVLTAQRRVSAKQEIEVSFAFFLFGPYKENTIKQS